VPLRGWKRPSAALYSSAGLVFVSSVREGFLEELQEKPNVRNGIAINSNMTVLNVFCLILNFFQYFSELFCLNVKPLWVGTSMRAIVASTTLTVIGLNHYLLAQGPLIHE
jgi:hypothetical protein